MGGLSRERRIHAIDVAIEEGEPELLDVVLLWLEAPDAAMISRLASIVGRLCDASAAQLAEVLTASREREAEAILIALLERRDPRVRSVVLRALARIGSIACIEPMSRIAQARSDDFAKIAHDAVERVRARSRQNAAGLLTVSMETEGCGALSTAEDRMGGLSELK
jgi:hypothetical protein